MSEHDRHNPAPIPVLPGDLHQDYTNRRLDELGVIVMRMRDDVASVMKSQSSTREDVAEIKTTLRAVAERQLRQEDAHDDLRRQTFKKHGETDAAIYNMKIAKVKEESSWDGPKQAILIAGAIAAAVTSVIVLGTTVFSWLGS